MDLLGRVLVFDVSSVWKHCLSSFPLTCDEPHHRAQVCLTCLVCTRKFCISPWLCIDTLGLRAAERATYVTKIMTRIGYDRSLKRWWRLPCGIRPRTTRSIECGNRGSCVTLLPIRRSDTS